MDIYLSDGSAYPLIPNKSGSNESTAKRTLSIVSVDS